MSSIVEGYARKKHPLYAIWTNMRDRCNNANNKDYKFYGARGIKVCGQWGDFERFVVDMATVGPRPIGFTLDRVNSCGDYSPANVRWSSKSKQARNQKIRSTNNSGTSGVNEMKCGGYVARITNNGERVYLGYFKNLDDAIAARLDAEIRYGWHNVK